MRYFLSIAYSEKNVHYDDFLFKFSADFLA